MKKTSVIHSKIFYLLALVSLLGMGASAIPLPNNADEARQSGAVTFAVIGDYGIAGQAEADVANLVKSWHPDFIVTVGDNNYPNGAGSTIDQNIGQYYHDYIFKYSGKYGKGSETRRFFPALGNHDWNDGSVRPYTKYFNLPGNERFYEFAYGSIHFFVLDSVNYEEDGNTADSPQAKWLQKQMSASTLPFQVVITHYPPYSSGKHGSVPFMQWPFKEWGADAVLAGHNHVYERIHVNGLTYFVNGLGGDDLGKFRSDILPETAARYNADYGAMRVEATSVYIKFQFVTRANLVVDEYVLSKNVPFVSNVTSASPMTTNASVIDFQVAFSEPVTGVDVSDFALTANGLSGAYVNAVNGAGENYVVTVSTGAGAGDLRLDLIDNDSIVNTYGAPLGNTGMGSGNRSSEIYAVDNSAPTVSTIRLTSASPTNAATVDFAVTLSESVTGVDMSDFSLSASDGASGANIISVSGSGAAHLVSVNAGSADNILRLDMVYDNSVTDLAGNLLGGSFTTSESYVIDKTAPSAIALLRASPNPTAALSVDFSVIFSEPVFNVDAADFVVSAAGINGAYVTNISGSGNAYFVSVNTGSESGELRLDLLNNPSVNDVVGNVVINGYAGETYTIDKTAPIVLSVVRANAELTNASSVDFYVTFSDAVTGVDAADFIVNMTGIGGAYVSGVNGLDANYTISVNTGAGDGALRLDVVDDDSIINAAANQLGALGAGNGIFMSGESYTVDKTPPAVLSILRINPDPSNAANVDYAVTFSEPVTGVDVSDFMLNTTSGATISAVNGAGASYLVSIITGAGLDSLRLDTLDNDSILDAANNSTGAIFTAGEIYTVNKVPPVVMSILRAIPNPINATSADFIVTFSEPVSGVDISDFTLTTSGVSGASIISVSGIDSAYVVSVNTGIDNGTLRLDVIDNNSIVSAIGNTLGGVNLNDGAFASGEVYDVVKFTSVDTVMGAPSLIAPLGNALLNVSTPKLTWLKLADTPSYEVVIARDNAFTQIVLAQTVAPSTYTTSALKDGAYYWRVRAYNLSGQPGKFSATESFTLDTTPPAVPVLLTPLNDSRLSSRFDFTWTKISDAVRYQVEIDNNADFSSPEWSSWRRDPYYSISGMTKGTSYWRVRTKDAADNWSVWSVIFKLIVP